MMHIRPPAVAGSFYPEDPIQLKNEIDSYFSKTIELINKPPKALIAPHAGTIYSGPIAASAYAGLKGHNSSIQTVILLGPSHRVAFEGLALSSADAFSTPLGNIPIQKELTQKLTHFSQVRVLDEAHQFEHSLELHLPFLQRVLNEFEIIPLVVGNASPQSISQVLEHLWGKEETLIVISSDLSHYLSYEEAKIADEITAKKIEKLNWDLLEEKEACGFFPIRGILKTASEKKMKAKRIDLRNSGETSGNRLRVVGYGAFHFYES